MKIKCEYAHADIKRLIIRDLQEKFPGLVAEENVLVGGAELVEVEVTLVETPSEGPAVSSPTTPLFIHTAPKAAHTAPKAARTPFDDPPALPPPPRPHSEREFDPSRASEPSGIETWGITPRG